MLFDLKGPLKTGDKLPITLKFEKAGKVQLSFDVKGIGAQGPGGEGSSDDQMHMKKMPDKPGMKMSRPVMSKAASLTVLPAIAIFTASPGFSLTLRWRDARRRSARPYKAVFAVPHGCAGSATTQMRIRISEGVIAVKPMPKAGWNVENDQGRICRRLRL